MKILISEQDLQQGICRMAEEIRQHYSGRPLTLIGVMIGSIMLLAELIRRLDMPLKVVLLQSRNHRGPGHPPGPLVIDLASLGADVHGRHVLLVDDLFSTGQTLWDLVPQVDELGAESVRTAVLLRKRDRQKVPINPDFLGFDIPSDIFAVGYGLDYQDRYRNLPHIAQLEDQDRGAGTGS
jgi:hypoxanthine phosphoribosyltransferase